tara:strand:- start:25027 stop:25533 length:507 start_codon:yes stop_codon:yes gene_type:complete
MLVCIDLSSLYFAIRGLNITVNYEKLVGWLKTTAFSELFESGDNPSTSIVDIQAFTIADPKNQSQSKFLTRLGELGVGLNVYDFNTKPNFSVELGVVAAMSSHEKIVIMSNDSALLRSFDLLKDRGGKDVALCFFSEKLDGSWTPKILSNEVKFLDLSNPKTRSAISS